MPLVRRYTVFNMLTASYVCYSPAKVQMDDCELVDDDRSYTTCESNPMREMDDGPGVSDDDRSYSQDYSSCEGDNFDEGGDPCDEEGDEAGGEGWDEAGSMIGDYHRTDAYEDPDMRDAQAATSLLVEEMTKLLAAQQQVSNMLNNLQQIKPL